MRTVIASRPCVHHGWRIAVHWVGAFLTTDSLGEAASSTPARASLRDSASPRGICLRSCEWIDDFEYIPSHTIYQADAARCRVSNAHPSHACPRLCAARAREARTGEPSAATNAPGGHARRAMTRHHTRAAPRRATVASSTPDFSVKSMECAAARNFCGISRVCAEFGPYFARLRVACSSRCLRG